MCQRYILLLASCCLITSGIAEDLTSPADSAGKPLHETVILLHGLARTQRSMKTMNEALTQAGYTVYTLDYRTTEKNVQQLVDQDLAPLIARCQLTAPAKIHFVAHSLGNIVLRSYFKDHSLDNAGRLVMLGPPNQGSEVVDKLGNFTIFKWLNGPAGQQLGTDRHAQPMRLPPPPLEFGVIAGSRSINWILSCLIPGPDDGKVSLKRARLDGMSDFIVVQVAHPFLMSNRNVIRLTLHFLQHGHFPHESASSGWSHQACASVYKKNDKVGRVTTCILL